MFIRTNFMSFAISDYISGTMTGEALKYLVTVALKPSHGSRLGQNNVRTVALVITDGKSQDYHRGTLSKWQRKAKVNIFFAFFNDVFDSKFKRSYYRLLFWSSLGYTEENLCRVLGEAVFITLNKY